ncbi:Crp/Fnr family transcriptional regulator [Niallia circulans]|jgi:CRP/FNR family transcriptional regulator, anaerobic regulatory protein|uniref:Crp/Fnr family transcriptional regulator n=1 Tax=Niallia TaxID=2837506 RepID=UPI00077C7F3D|nr:Crp/Fnr family transcriptional regulator [Niallia circulans]MDR4316374.1 Crp/Fnr family transcriptional regulator [Niallia circulans]MED3838456.1 Crp/Fnr family transcriptional regulator [Niallia circulans]MED4243929.1 Crp/Fnr family transcriptional regulator [Niallia circulans]MED4246323.1 Crp/Fnr family transcriptional regulator [Niallia circulans]MED5098919.1 Crp/Fnr family transcriptional regulator [Niallia circulans]
MKQQMVSPCPKRVPIFYSLSDLEIKKITDVVHHKLFKKGEMIIEEGDISTSLYIIHSGKVKLSKLTIQGKEQIVHLLTTGDFFGESNLFHDDMVMNLSCHALEDTKICVLKKQDFDQIMLSNPEISFKLLKTITKRLSHTEDLARTLATKDPEVRIADMLLEFCEKFGTEHQNTVLITLPITREEVSSYVGLTRETISRKLAKLVDKGILSLIGNKQILIHNKGKLQSIGG